MAGGRASLHWSAGRICRRPVVELLAKVHQVEAPLAEGRADRRRGRGLAGAQCQAKRGCEPGHHVSCTRSRSPRVALESALIKNFAARARTGTNTDIRNERKQARVVRGFNKKKSRPPRTAAPLVPTLVRATPPRSASPPRRPLAPPRLRLRRPLARHAAAHPAAKPPHVARRSSCRPPIDSPISRTARSAPSAGPPTRRCSRAQTTGRMRSSSGCLSP